MTRLVIRLNSVLILLFYFLDVQRTSGFVSSVFRMFQSCSLFVFEMRWLIHDGSKLTVELRSENTFWSRNAVDDEFDVSLYGCPKSEFNLKKHRTS